MRRRLPYCLAALSLAGLLAFALSGCATPAAPTQPLVVTKTIYVPWTFPAALTTCASNPAALPAPHVLATDQAGGSKVARYVVALRAHDSAALAAADDCRQTLGAAVDAAAPATPPEP